MYLVLLIYSKYALCFVALSGNSHMFTRADSDINL